jgi:hypothetical protein
MAQMLAPYNNSMRLGQGFNSYTQQICLDKAVLPDTEYNRQLVAARAAKTTVQLSAGSSQPATGELKQSPRAIEASSAVPSSSAGAVVPTKPDNLDAQKAETPNGSESKETKAVETPPWVKPQIVTYSSRFVDKLSDVTSQCAK